MIGDHYSITKAEIQARLRWLGNQQKQLGGCPKQHLQQANAYRITALLAVYAELRGRTAERVYVRTNSDGTLQPLPCPYDRALGLFREEYWRGILDGSLARMRAAAQPT